LKAGEEDFAPKLPVTPLVTDILGESDLIVITDALAGRKGGTFLGSGEKVSAVTKGSAEIPGSGWPITNPAADGGMIPAKIASVPVAGAR